MAEPINLDHLPHWRRIEIPDSYRSKENLVACENCGTVFPTDDFQTLLHLLARRPRLLQVQCLLDLRQLLRR